MTVASRDPQRAAAILGPDVPHRAGRPRRHRVRRGPLRRAWAAIDHLVLSAGPGAMGTRPRAVLGRAPGPFMDTKFWGYYDAVRAGGRHDRRGRLASPWSAAAPAASTPPAGR